MLCTPPIATGKGTQFRVPGLRVPSAQFLRTRTSLRKRTHSARGVRRAAYGAPPRTRMRSRRSPCPGKRERLAAVPGAAQRGGTWDSSETKPAWSPGASPGPIPAPRQDPRTVSQPGSAHNSGGLGPSSSSHSAALLCHLVQSPRWAWPPFLPQPPPLICVRCAPCFQRSSFYFL